MREASSKSVRGGLTDSLGVNLFPKNEVNHKSNQRFDDKMCERAFEQEVLLMLHHALSLMDPERCHLSAFECSEQGHPFPMLQIDDEKTAI